MQNFLSLRNIPSRLEKNFSFHTGNTGTSFQVLGPTMQAALIFLSLLFPCRFVHRPKFRDVPLKENFNITDDILASVWAMSSIDGASIQSNGTEKLLQVIRESVVPADHYRTRTAVGAVKTLEDLSHVLNRNGSAAATVEAKSAEWLEENGTYSSFRRSSREF